MARSLRRPALSWPLGCHVMMSLSEVELAEDQFGNFVVQKLLDVKDRQDALLTCMKGHAAWLQVFGLGAGLCRGSGSVAAQVWM